MKKFILKFACFTLPIVLLAYPLDVWLSSFISKQSSIDFCADEFSVWNDVFEGKIDSDIAIYGSSRAWVNFNTSLMTNALGHNAYNFGVDGHNFWMQYLRHQLYLKHNRKPKVIVLSVDYVTLQKRKNLYNYVQFLPYMLWDKDIMRSTSSYEGFDTYDFQIPLLRYFGEFSLLGDAIYLSLIEQGKEVKRERGFAGKDETWNDDLEKAKKKKKSYKVAFDKSSIDLFDKFLKECADKDIEVLMVHAPIHVEGLEYIENQDEVLKIFKDFASKYRLDFLDYSMDAICQDKSFFYNAGHLNSKGANLFTTKLIEDIKSTKTQEKLN